MIDYDGTDMRPPKCPMCGSLNLEKDGYDEDYCEYAYTRYWMIQCQECGQSFELQEDFVLAQWSLHDLDEGEELDSDEDSRIFNKKNREVRSANRMMSKRPTKRSSPKKPLIRRR